MPEKKKQELKDRAPIVAAYLRVSTDKQTILNQKSEVINFCHRQELKITMWCTETVSGTKKESERELGTLLKKLQKGDVLIITEVSRLSRKMMNIMNIIHQSIEKGSPFTVLRKDINSILLSTVRYSLSLLVYVLKSNVR